MLIRVARVDEYDEVVRFYYDLIDAMEGAEFKPAWQKEVYPTRQFLRDSIAAGELLVAVEGDEITGAMVLNQAHVDGYEKVTWAVAAADDEVAVIHALGIHPRHQGKGIAKALVAYALENGRERGLKALRLDVLAGNKPAENLYPALGFQYRDTLQLFYDDTGLVDYKLFEAVL